MSNVHALSPGGTLAVERACRSCGCTEAHACYRPDQGGCSWVESDLCSACAPAVYGERGRRRWRLAFWILLIAVLLFWTACFVDAWFASTAPASLDPAVTPPSPSHQVASGSTWPNTRNL